jgi:hypothetical protein
MGIKRIKIQNQRTAAGSGYFKKTSLNCRVSRKPGKEEPGRFLGGYFTFTIWDLGFKTSTDKLTEILKKSPAPSPASPLPHPPKPSSQTQRLTELIYMMIGPYGSPSKENHIFNYNFWMNLFYG